MTAAALRLGPLGPADPPLMRSGLRWLVPDGHRCAAGELIAYCNIAAPAGSGLFADEPDDVQVAFAVSHAGQVVRRPEVSPGGYLDRLPHTPWRAGTVVADLAGAEGAARLRLLCLAGRRTSDSAEDRSGLMTGWHDRARAWWGDDGHDTLFAAGTCEQNALVRGAGGFVELFAAYPGSAHVVHWQQEPQVASARTLLEQLDRTPAQTAAIAEDMLHGVAAAGAPSTGADLLLLGALLGALGGKPLADGYDIVTRTGFRRIAPPPRTVVLSLHAELPQMLRHRTLGYSLNCPDFQLERFGPAVRAWVKSRFRPVPRTPADVQADYRALLARLPGTTGLVVMNAISTLRHESVSNYRFADAPSLSSVRARTLNLMLDDLADEGGVTVLDQDAIAARLGIAAHFADGAHNSGALNDALRAELIRLTAPAAAAPFGAAGIGRVSR